MPSLPSLPSLLIIQWGIVGFFVVIYFLLGFLRGGSKSTYFTIVSFITTFVSLFAISFISIRFLLTGSNTLVSFIQQIEGLVGGGFVPDEVYAYLADPLIVAFAVALIDLVLRIIGFIVLYPLIKGLLTLIIFRPIWSFGIKRALIARQNDKLADKAAEKGITFKPKRRLKKNFFGRFWGGIMGAFQGALVAFVTLMPILIIAGFLTVPASEGELNQQNPDVVPLATTLPGLGGITSMLDDYLVQIDELNTQGLGAILKQIKVAGKPIDRYIFDRIFTTQFKQGEDVKNINWINELEGILNIARVVYDGEYIHNGVQLSDIDESKLDDLNTVFSYLKKSDLIALMIPTAAQFGLSQFKDQLPTGITEQSANDALEAFKTINWNNEFNNIQGIVEALLTFGSVEELQAYLADPMTLLDLSPEEGVKLANVVRAMGNLQILNLVSFGAEYATTMTQLQSQISWLDDEDRQAYLEEKLAFIIQSEAFFNGTDGEFARLALLIEAIFTDEHGDVNLRQLIDIKNVDDFVAAQNEDWIDGVLERVVDLELLLNAIPVGVDYALYTQLGSLVDQALASRIETALNDISWQDEILNVGDIYKEVVRIGAAELLGDNPNYLEFLDKTVENNLSNVRVIIGKIFTDSALVNAALELAAPLLVERFVTDESLRLIINDILISDPESDVVDFNVGQELNTLLSIIEKIYIFSSASELVTFGQMVTESKFELFSRFGSLTLVEFNELKDSFESLQILSRIGSQGLAYVKELSGIEQIFVPETVNLNEDLGSILGLAYEVARYTYQNRLAYPTYQDIDFAPLFASQTFRSYLIPTALNNHSELLIANIANFAKVYAEDASFGNYLSVPASLMAADPEAVEWRTEISALLGAIFDIAASFENSTAMTLSYNGAMSFAQAPTEGSITLITQFANLSKAEDTFGNLDSSVVLRSSIKQIIDTFGTQTEGALGGYAVKTPDIAVDNDMLKENVFVNLIHGLAVFVDGLNATWGYTKISELTASLTPDTIIPAFNALNDQVLIDFANIILIRGVISEAILSDDIKAFGIEKLNGAQSFIVAPSDFLDLDPTMIDADGLKAIEIANLLISIKSLQVNSIAELSSFGPTMLNNMIGRNVVLGKDDLDRFLGSNILYIFLDKALKLDGLNAFVDDALSSAFDGANVTIDLSPHPDILGNAIDDEPIEVGRIRRVEFRNIIVSLGLLGDITAIGIETFPAMIDPYAEEDDFTTFLNSNFIYVIVGRLFENQAFGDYVGGFISGAFGDDIDLVMSAPSDAKGTTGVEEGIISKVELRYIMVSFKLLGLDQSTDINQDKIFGLYGANDVDGTDDLDRFIQSKYLADKLSSILTSDTLIEMLSAGRFTPAEFELPISAYTIIDGRVRLTNDEIVNMFAGIDVIGTDKIIEGTFVPEDIFGLSSAQVNSILNSDYLYTVIDLMLKSEPSFTVPAQALETAGIYEGMVMKSEISDIFTALQILGASDGSIPNAEDITVGQLIDLLDQTNSAIVQALISQAIIDALGSDNIPADAYESTDLLTSDEIDAIVQALSVIAGDDNVSILDVADMIETLTLEQVNNIDLTESGSKTIKQMISDSIINQLGLTNIPEDAYFEPLNSNQGTVLLGVKLEGGSGPKRFSDEELQNIVLAINVLLNNDPDALITSISADITVSQVQGLKGNQSFVIRQLISDQIEQALEGVVVIPDAAYIDVDKTRISDDQIGYMIDALAILADSPDDLVTTLDLSVTVGDVRGLKDNPSLIIRQLITDKLEDILDGVVVIPLASYDTENPTMLSFKEYQDMIDAIYELSGRNDALDVEMIETDVTVGKLRGLRDNESLIIRQLVTKNVEDVLATEVTFPDEAYDVIHPTMLSFSEFQQMIDAIYELSGRNDNLDVQSIDTDVTVGKLKGLKGNTSYIINQLMSDNIVQTLTDLGNVIPDSAFVDPVTKTILKNSEIENMIDAIDVLANGNDNLPVANIDTDITIGQLKSLSVSESIIIQRLLADNIVDNVPLNYTPEDIYVDPVTKNQLKADELAQIILALEVLAGSVVSGDKDDELVADVINIDPTVGQTKALKTNTSEIINQLISEAIVDSLTSAGTFIPDSAYTDPVEKNTLTPDEVDHMIDALDVLANGNDNLPVANIDTDITIGQLKSLSVSESIIIQRLLADNIVDNVPLNYTPEDIYVDPVTKNQLKAVELENMILALDILAGSVVENDMNHVRVSEINTDPTIGQIQLLNQNGSLIIHQLISESIVDALIGRTIPDEAYSDPVAKITLSDDEIDEMIDALVILSNNNLSTRVSMLVIDVTVGQTQDLKTNQSLIIRQMISDEIVTSLSGQATIPNDAYRDPIAKDRLTDDEINHMIDALLTLANGNLSLPVASIDTDITIGQLDELNDNNSVIMKKLISDTIVDNVGPDKVPNETYLLDTPGNNLKPAEIGYMIDALRILAEDPLDPLFDVNTKLVKDINFDVTVGQTQDLKINPSLIIKQVISDAIVDMLTVPKIRVEAFIGSDVNGRLENDEIGYMIDALLVLSNNDESMYVKDITVNENALSVATLQSFNENSLILNRLISNAIIDGLDADDIPVESFENSTTKTDIIRIEIDAILEALDILGITPTNAGSLGTNQLTFAKIDEVVAIGTNDPAYSWGFSPIVVHLLSEPMITAVSDVRADSHDYGIPSIAYRENGKDLLHSEIEGLIAALKLIGNVQPAEEATKTVADITVDTDDFNGDMILGLVALDSFIVYRMISRGINDAGIATIPSRAVDGVDNNYDPSLPNPTLIYDIKVAEMTHIGQSMNTLGISSIASIASEITVAKLKELDDEQVEALVEADTDGPNTIIYYIISDTVDSSLDPFSKSVLEAQNAYDDNDRLKRAFIVDALDYL